MVCDFCDPTIHLHLLGCVEIDNEARKRGFIGQRATVSVRDISFSSPSGSFAISVFEL
jgi:hypothetical protein